VKTVVVIDEAKRQALAIVAENQLSLAIGKQGLNVRLANRLVDWNIDVKTDDQFAEMDINVESKKAVSALFGDIEGEPSEAYEEEEEITKISELPGIPERIIAVLSENGIELIEALVAMTDEDVAKIPGLTQDDIKTLQSIIEDNIDIIEEEGEGEEGEGEEETLEEYECPECGTPVTADMTTCPNCGVGLSFEEASEES
jgi:N utilization substance protein A